MAFGDENAAKELIVARQRRNKQKSVVNTFIIKQTGGKRFLVYVIKSLLLTAIKIHANDLSSFVVEAVKF
jgi:hypothetical protein